MQTTRFDAISIKILNAAIWDRSFQHLSVSLLLGLEDYIPEMRDFYKKKHPGRKLLWYTITYEQRSDYLYKQLCNCLTYAGIVRQESPSERETVLGKKPS